MNEYDYRIWAAIHLYHWTSDWIDDGESTLGTASWLTPGGERKFVGDLPTIDEITQTITTRTGGEKE